MNKYEYEVPASKQIEVVFCSDAANEGDDSFALAQGILSPKLKLQGLVATHFGEQRSADSMEESYQECCRLAKLLDFNPEKVYRGNRRALAGAAEKLEISEGAKFLAEAARQAQNKLYVGVMGPLTDVAAALLLDESISGKIHVVWTGTTLGMAGGDSCREANARKDKEALNIVMKKCRDLSVIPFETYSQALVSLAELQLKVGPCGELGRHLFGRLQELNVDESRSWTAGESWCLGDNTVVGMLLNPRCAKTRKESRYVLDAEGRPQRIQGEFTLVFEMNMRYILGDLFAKLALFAGSQSEIRI